MGGSRRVLACACVSVAVALPLAVACPAAADPNPDQAVANLNAWRVQLGESPVDTQTVDAWNTGCQHHNAYQQIHGALGHNESDTSQGSGWTYDGYFAGLDSVLGENQSSPYPTPDEFLLPAPVWDGAVFHRAGVLQPRLGQIGFNATTFAPSSRGGLYTSWTCLWEQNGLYGPQAIDNSRKTDRVMLYASPANGAYDVPTTFPGNETPDPNQETGVPQGSKLGWLLNVEINGPWADGGGGSNAWAHSLTVTFEAYKDVTTKTSVPFVLSRCGETGCSAGTPGATAEASYLQGGFGIFPLQPLTPNTTYKVTATGKVTSRISNSTTTQPFPPLTWCFSTGPTYTQPPDCPAVKTPAGPEPGAPPQPLTVSVSGKGAVSARRISCPGACSTSYQPGTDVTLTASPESGQSFLGWSGGGCSGTAPTCIVTISADTTVGASFTSIQPPAPGAPKVSAASVSGLTSGRRKLAFAINAGENAPAIQTVVIAPPSGVSFSKKAKDLKQDITVYGPDGKRLRSTAKVGAGRLTITLKTPARALEVTITGAELALSRSFVSKLKRRTLKSFAVLVTALDAGGTPTVLRLAFKLR